jgi:ABC-type sugar transport system substrate-binding protein
VSKFRLIVMFVLVAIVLTSCGQKAAPTATPVGAEAPYTGPVEEYVVIALNWQHPYWNDIKAGAMYFEEVMGGRVKVTIAGPEAPDFPGQIDAVIQQIAKKPAGMLVACFDPGVIPAINQAVDAGIPVGTFEADIMKDNKRWFFVGVNPYFAGWAMGPELIKYAGETGKVVFSTNMGASNTQEKDRGFRDFLKDYPGWEIVGAVEDEGLVRDGADALKPLLQANPDVTAIVGFNAGSGGAAATAVKELDLVGKVKIICQDRDDITLQFIQEGVIDSTIVTRSADNTYVGLLMLYQYNHFQVPITKDNKANNVVWLPGSIDVGTVVVDKSNAAAFLH